MLETRGGHQTVTPYRVRISVADFRVRTDIDWSQLQGLESATPRPVRLLDSQSLESLTAMGRHKQTLELFPIPDLQLTMLTMLTMPPWP